jgi:hypothetical protein
LVAELRIDGQQLGEKYALDVLQLTRSLAQTGEYFIFTCACGVPSCAGLTAGAQTVVVGDQVSLVGSLPKGGSFAYILSAAQARTAVAEAIYAEKAFLDGACEGEEGEFPVLGFTAYSYKSYLAALAG